MTSVLRAGCLFLLLGTLVLVGRSWSEPRAAPGSRNRIALINLALVYKDYARAIEFGQETKAMLKPYEEKLKDLKEQVDAHKKALQKKDLADDIRNQHETNLKTRQKEWENLSNEAKNKFARKNEEQVPIVYKDAMDAAQRYARAHDIDLVLHYNDLPADSPEYLGFANISRKIQNGACTPLYQADGMDITKEILASLNETYHKEKGND